MLYGFGKIAFEVASMIGHSVLVGCLFLNEFHLKRVGSLFASFSSEQKHRTKRAT